MQQDVPDILLLTLPSTVLHVIADYIDLPSLYALISAVPILSQFIQKVIGSRLKKRLKCCMDSRSPGLFERLEQVASELPAKSIAISGSTMAKRMGIKKQNVDQTLLYNPLLPYAMYDRA